MPDTVRTVATLQAMLSDGAAAHSTNRQLIRDLLVSLDAIAAAYAASGDVTTLSSAQGYTDTAVAPVQKYPLLGSETGVTNLAFPYGDVRRHGASAAGTSAANSTAVQSAVDSAIALGRTVVDFANLDLPIANAINISGAAGLHIRSSGGRIRKPAGTSTSNIFRIVNCTNVHVYGFDELDGGYTGVSTGSNPVIQIGDPADTTGMLNENIHIHSMRIKNGNHACITAWGETNTGIEGNRNLFMHDLVLERAGAGIFIYKGCKGLYIRDVAVKGVGANGVVLDTRAATDTNTTTSYPIRRVRISGLRVTDVTADTGFEPRAIVVKGACYNVLIDGLEANVINANDGVTARNTYGVLIAQSAAPGSGAVATANLTGTSVTSFTVSAGGTLYTTPPTVFISSSTGAGAIGTAVLTGGAVTSIDVIAGGEGYIVAPNVILIAGEVGEDIKIVNSSMENIQDLVGTTGWPVYVQTGFRDVLIDNVRTKNCKRGMNVDAADNVTFSNCTTRDGPIQASTFPIQIAGVSAVQPATNIKITNCHCDRGTGLASATHPISLNFCQAVRLHGNTQRGYDTGLYSISTTNAKGVSGAIGSATVDPANLADAGGTTLGVTCNGAELGDFVECGFSNVLSGITLTAWVSATNTVQCRFQNESGGALDLASGILWVRTTKP